LTGDLDLSGGVDQDDIATLVLGLNSPQAYADLFGIPAALAGDTDGDGDLDFDDLSGFAAILGGNAVATAVRRLDVDGPGSIDAELASAISFTRGNASPFAAEPPLPGDTDGDGDVDFDDIAAASDRDWTALVDILMRGES
jgi:hypothetical protein